MISDDLRIKHGFAKLPHSFWGITWELSVGVKFFIAYLLSMDNYFGDTGEFYRTDEEIQKDIRVGRGSIQRWRKRLKTTPFVDFIPGKYKGSATTYNVKGIKMMLSNGTGGGRVSKRDAERVKRDHKAYQNGSESVSKWPNDKERKEERKEEGKEESSEGSASAYPESQASPSLDQPQDLKDGLLMEDLIEKAGALLRDNDFSGTVQGLVKSGADQTVAEEAVKAVMYNHA